jgi:hypothetical protein
MVILFYDSISKLDDEFLNIQVHFQSNFNTALYLGEKIPGRLWDKWVDEGWSLLELRPLSTMTLAAPALKIFTIISLVAKELVWKTSDKPQ